MMFTRALIYLVIVNAFTVYSLAASAPFIYIYTTDNSYVSEYEPDDNFGNETASGIGRDYGEIRGMLLYDLSPYSGVTVLDAYLRLYVYSFGSDPPSDPWVARFSGSWDESTITWNNQPGWDDKQYTASNPPLDDYWYINITDWVIEWIDDSHENYGVLLGSDETEDHDWAAFRTKEYYNENRRPILVLEYTQSSIESASLGEIKAIYK
ncbi:MAG: DNRLRE domain-containing protein [bacterium]|nr:DNRLRE domain-containing protein [bacterium]